ncbi:hypothetical protein EVAR_29427_1 [Eumeta japonica]|uniref:Uncharacterized protein n=1 Tax=Eumeta variegata TaxID=151549 RepID=A0A4C1VUM9_EUMVA|nr:hypothetical protein EVAR_29427_1 [Eumeta japonica]
MGIQANNGVGNLIGIALRRPKERVHFLAHGARSPSRARCPPASIMLLVSHRVPRGGAPERPVRRRPASRCLG